MKEMHLLPRPSFSFVRVCINFSPPRLSTLQSITRKYWVINPKEILGYQTKGNTGLSIQRKYWVIKPTVLQYYLPKPGIELYLFDILNLNWKLNNAHKFILFVPLAVSFLQCSVQGSVASLLWVLDVDV